MRLEDDAHPREGDEELSDHRDMDSSDTSRGKSKTRRGRKPEGGARARAGDVGKALRSVYDTTLREEVPADFLSLLGKLQ